MPTIKDKLYFNFDGKWSNEFNLIHVVLSSGMYEETFVANRNIVETSVSGSRKPNFQRVEEEPLEFELNLAFEHDFDEDKIDDIIRWLYVDYYRPLYFEGEEGRVFHCMPSGDSKITHNGMSQGYITITMRCDSANVYSPTFKSFQYDFSQGGSHIIELVNDGHLDVYPEISIEKVGNGKITIESMSDGGKIFEILNLTNIENIYIDCEKEIIESDIVGVTRYDDVLGEYIKLRYGINVFRITGNCIIQFRYRYKYRF